MGRSALEVKPSARKELERLSDNVIARVVTKIEGLLAEPRPPGCKKLQGYRDHWRIQVGDYRVVYIVDDAARLVSITRIFHRRDVYET